MSDRSSVTRWKNSDGYGRVSTPTHWVNEKGAINYWAMADGYGAVSLWQPVAVK